jgi:hypothetical protein
MYQNIPIHKFNSLQDFYQIYGNDALEPIQISIEAFPILYPKIRTNMTDEEWGSLTEDQIHLINQWFIEQMIEEDFTKLSVNPLINEHERQQNLLSVPSSIKTS